MVCISMHQSKIIERESICTPIYNSAQNYNKVGLINFGLLFSKISTPDQNNERINVLFKRIRTTSSSTNALNKLL